MATVHRVPEDDKQTFLDRFKRNVQNQVRLLSAGDPSEATFIAAIKTFESLERQLERVRGRLLTDEISNQLQQSLSELLYETRSELGESRVSTAFQTPKLKGAGRCAPKYVITNSQLAFLVRLNMTAGTMAEAFQVSESTIRRRLSFYNIRLRNKYTDLNNDSLDSMVTLAISRNRKLGALSIKHRLQSAGVIIQRERVRESVNRVDPVGVALRALQPKLQRSIYSVASPNSLWHIDGNHKLIRWGIVIHGGIDGASRLLVYLAASNNNLASTVLERYTVAVGHYGVPARLRIDHGVENNAVSVFMQLLRGPEAHSVIYGKSCHNQRIERAWVDVWNGVTNVYYTVFAYLEYRGFLDPDSHLDLWLLHYVYLPRINEDMEMFRAQWNCHGLSTERGRSPEQLFVLGVLKNANSRLTAVRDILDRDGVPIRDPDVVTPDEAFQLLGRTRVSVPRLECPLSEKENSLLLLEVNPLAENDDHGMSIFLYAKRLIADLRSEDT